MKTVLIPELQTARGRSSGQAPLDARGADWRGEDLKGLDLSEAKLCRVDLRGADLSGACLKDADLRLAKYDQWTIWPDEFQARSCGAIGPGARLNGQFFNGADLRHLNLAGASFLGAYLSGADLSGSVLDDVSFVGADLRLASFKGAHCHRARFGTAQLDGVDFRGADLTDADIASCETIKGADFSLCIGITELAREFLQRDAIELDSWNPLTRCHTRSSLESLGQKE